MYTTIINAAINKIYLQPLLIMLTYSAVSISVSLKSDTATGSEFSSKADEQ